MYTKRSSRTCQRWEKNLGLPVYRVNKDSICSKVFAYKSEIDHWFKRKKENARKNDKNDQKEQNKKKD